MDLNTQIIVRMSTEQKRRLFQSVEKDGISHFVRDAVEEKLSRIEKTAKLFQGRGGLFGKTS